MEFDIDQLKFEFDIDLRDVFKGPVEEICHDSKRRLEFLTNNTPVGIKILDLIEVKSKEEYEAMIANASIRIPYDDGGIESLEEVCAKSKSFRCSLYVPDNRVLRYSVIIEDRKILFAISGLLHNN